MKFLERSCPSCNLNTDSSIWALENFNFKELNEFAFASRKIPEYMHYQLLHCRNCHILYSSPIPDSSYLAHSYHEAAFDSQEEAELASLTYAKLLPTIKSEIGEINSALDIGTGEGAFLDKLLVFGVKNIQGIEPSMAAIQVARNNVKKLIIHDFFNRNSFKDETFDLITCFQTLEHLENPRDFIESVFHILKPGGCFYVVCHNYQAFSTKILGLKSPIFDIEHMQLFSPNGAKTILNKCGFIKTTAKPIVNSYPLYYWIKLFPLPIQIKKIFLNIFKFPILRKIKVPIPAGNFYAIGFKPKMKE